MKKELIISGLLLFGLANIAFAQSTVSGTLTGGSGGSNQVTGTVTSPSGGGSLSGTVTAPPQTPNTGGGTSGGGGGGGSTVVTDYCTNISGVQTSLPAGYGVQNGVCTPLSTGGGSTVTPNVPNTGGTSTVTPGVPNTGAGGAADELVLILTLSGMTALGTMGYLLRRRIV